MWDRVCGDQSMSKLLYETYPNTKEWRGCRIDGKPLCLLMSCCESKSEPKRSIRDVLGGEKEVNEWPTTNNTGLATGSDSRVCGVTKDYISLQFPAWSNFAPLLLLQPMMDEMYTAAKWQGMKEVKYWISKDDLERKNRGWKIAHQLHVQGYEDKKQWAKTLQRENQ